MPGTGEEMSSGVMYSKSRTKEHVVQRKLGHSQSCRQLSPPSTMLPLGLGTGPGLGSQNGKVHKTPPSSSSTDSTKASYTEPQDWGVNARDEKGRTALHFACGMVPADCARLLLDAGADVHARDKDGYTPLHMAAGYGRCNCVKLLLDHGANVFARERAGRTPRELAGEIRDDGNQAQEVVKVPRGDIDQTIQLLTEAESKCVDNAAQERSRKLSKISHSAPTLSNSYESHSIATNEFGKSKKSLCSAALENALTVACRGGHVDVVELLLSSGAHVDAHDPDGATPLLAAADSGFANCVQLLLKHGANADAKDRVGVTALIAAAYNGHSDCLEVLLGYKASVDAKSHGGVTPLIAAAEGCNADCTQVLLLAGAQVNARTSEGKTALMHAVSRNCVEATESLLNGGAEINAGDGEGFTALHHGARNNSAECLRILLEKGADVTRKCRRGRTPLQEAPKDSEAAKLLEERWKMLESEIAMRQMEVLNLFEQDRNMHKSNTSKKSSTRQAREKKNGRRKKEPVEKADLAKQALPKLTSTVKAGDEPVSVDVLSSSPGSEVAMEQPSPNLVLGNEEDSASDKSTHLSCGGGQDNDTLGGLFKTEKESSLKSPLIVTNTMSCSSGASAPSSAENVCNNLDEWIRVDGKRTAAVGSSPKTNASQSKPQGSAASTVSSLRPADHLSIETKISGGQSIKHIQGSSKILKEIDGKDDESSPWVQVLLRRTHSIGDGTSARPIVEVPSKPNSPLESKAEDHIWETAIEFSGNTEEKLSDRVHRIEIELNQARLAARAHMQRVKELEMLVSTRQVEKSDANSAQVTELTHALEFQIRARVQAENAKTVLEFRIRDLEAVVSSQSKALETAQAEIEELKLQMLRREERHKQECEVQHRESIAAALAAAAGSCRAWEFYHSRESLRGWIPECAETSRSEFAPSLLRSASASSYKMDEHLSTLDSPRTRKLKGDQEVREESFEWKSTAAAAAIAAASMIRSKSCTFCSALNSHLSCLPHNVSSINSVSEALSKLDSPECTLNDHEVDGKGALEDSANQEPSKIGKGIVRSASEGSLHSTGSGADQRVQQDLLPFIPMAGPKTDPVNGWFSLVPSPVD